MTIQDLWEQAKRNETQAATDLMGTCNSRGASKIRQQLVRFCSAKVPESSEELQYRTNAFEIAITNIADHHGGSDHRPLFG